MSAGSTPINPPIIEVDLGSNGGRFAPRSVDEAQAWLQREQAFWGWLRSGSFGGHVSPLHSALHSIYEALNAAQRAQQYPDPSSQIHELNAIRAGVEQAFNQFQLPHSSTSKAKAIEEYRQENGEQSASFYLASLVPPSSGHQIEPRTYEHWKGWIEGLVATLTADKATKRKIVAYEKALDELHGSQSAMFLDKQKAIDSLEVAAAAHEKSFGDFIAETAAHFATEKQRWDSELASAIEANSAQRRSIEAVFREGMKLRAPVDYWSSKAAAHGKTAQFFAFSTVVMFIVAAVSMGFAVHSIFGGLTAGQHPSTWHVGVLLSFGLFYVWAIRILVRNYLSNVHLQTDAEERVVMVQTYLALTEDEKVEGKEDRQIILHSLFRPATDGLVKDEGVPLSLADLLTRK